MIPRKSCVGAPTTSSASTTSTATTAASSCLIPMKMSPTWLSLFVHHRGCPSSSSIRCFCGSCQSTIALTQHDEFAHSFHIRVQQGPKFMAAMAHEMPSRWLVNRFRQAVSVVDAVAAVACHQNMLVVLLATLAAVPVPVGRIPLIVLSTFV